MKTSMATESISDEQLVEWSLTGDREAFGKIVERYQALVCSITYGATGSLTLSEDLAQETFLTAWRKLEGLTDAKKLRAWLCGIARNLTLYSMRRGQREPVRDAAPIETIQEPASLEPSPAAQAVSHEEEAILWRALERIPESYREPLILFYREHRSIERVARELELSEDAVKQRLSRGRAMLTEQVAAFVEDTLERTTPGQAFTLGVLATLPGLALSAKAATVGAAAAKGSAPAKAAAIGGILGALSMLVFAGSYASYRLRLAEIQTDEERRHVNSFYRKIGAFVAGIFAVFAAAMFWVCRNQPDHSLLISLLVTGLMVIYFLTTSVFTASCVRWQRAYYSRILEQECGGKLPPAAWEYRSRWSFFGLPLVHIRMGDRFDVIKKPVTAWIAVGKYAVGGLFAFGELAIAPAPIGWCAIGLLPFGCVAFGLLAIGGCTLGVWAFGGLAMGWKAFGGCALAWKAAVGGIALAYQYALGGIAHGGEASMKVARAFAQADPFFNFATHFFRYFAWMNLLWVLPLMIMWAVVARAKKSSAAR